MFRPKVLLISIAYVFAAAMVFVAITYFDQPPINERLPRPIQLTWKGATMTGIPVGLGLVLTNKHYPGTKWAYHPDLDIALVERGFQPDFLSKAPVRLSEPRFGERFLVIGYPLGGPLSVSCGFASDELGRFSVPIAPGNSGSPVLDEDGRFVGVVNAVAAIGGPFGGRSLVYHHSYYVPASGFWDWFEMQMAVRELELDPTLPLPNPEPPAKPPSPPPPSKGLVPEPQPR